ncbi:hypothetical protein [Achromobacter marplatensis]
MTADSQESLWIVYLLVAFGLSAWISHKWAMPWFVPYAWFAAAAFLWRVAEPAINRPYRPLDLADLFLLLVAVVIAAVVTAKRRNY